MTQTWYHYRGELILGRPLEPPDCWEEPPAEPYEEEYDRMEDEMCGRTRRLLAL